MYWWENDFLKQHGLTEEVERLYNQIIQNSSSPEGRLKILKNFLNKNTYSKSIVLHYLIYIIMEQPPTVWKSSVRTKKEEDEVFQFLISTLKFKSIHEHVLALMRWIESDGAKEKKINNLLDLIVEDFYFTEDKVFY